MGGIGFRPVGGASLRTLGWAPLPVRLPSPAAASFQPCPPVGAVSVAAAAVPVGASALSPRSFPPGLGSSPAMALLTAAARLWGAKVSGSGREARRRGVGLRRPQALRHRASLPPRSAPLRALKGPGLGRPPAVSERLGHVLRCPSFRRRPAVPGRPVPI